MLKTPEDKSDFLCHFEVGKCYRDTRPGPPTRYVEILAIVTSALGREPFTIQQVLCTSLGCYFRAGDLAEDNLAGISQDEYRQLWEKICLDRSPSALDYMEDQRAETAQKQFNECT